MNDWNKENVAIIMAGEGFQYAGFIGDGFKVFHPYKTRSLFMRILRELCFRLPLLPKTLWYKTDVLKEDLKYIVLIDVLITSHYIKWIQQHFPEAQINYVYDNMVGRARNLYPDQIPDGVRLWTYDDNDAQKYKIKLYKHHMYFPSYVKPKQQPEYDVFFIGRDKGRGEMLLELQHRFEAQGLRTKFVITKDGRFSSNKPYYRPEISYEEVREHLTKSKAVLNVILKGQTGITVRDLESVFFGIKLITTNPHIRDFDFYCPENMFILEEDNIDMVRDFLNKPTAKIGDEILDSHLPQMWLDEVFNG